MYSDVNLVTMIEHRTLNKSSRVKVFVKLYHKVCRMCGFKLEQRKA